MMAIVVVQHQRRCNQMNLEVEVQLMIFHFYQFINAEIEHTDMN